MTNTNNRPPPRYVINPALVRSRWTGDAWGFRAFRNPDRLNSFWLGTGWNFMCLPQRAYYEVLAPLLRGNVGYAIVGLIEYVLLTFAFFIMGLFGKLRMLPYGMEVIADALILEEADAKLAIEKGMKEALMEMRPAQ